MALRDHKFAAVLFSDIEGYTSMIQENEEKAIQLVNRYQKELEQMVPSFNGEVMQHYGDGSLTVFSKAADAVACAFHLQKKLQGNIPLRMGVHFGKVVLHDEKVFGDTVNIASRIESLGQPGAVLFSKEVLKEIESTGEYQVISMGKYRFKNVKSEMEVFALGNEGLNIPKSGSLKGKLEPEKRSKTPFIVSGLLGLAVIILAILYAVRTPVPEDNILTASINPSIAVLPFANLSTDSAQDYFADGLAQEVLILLTQDPQLRVTSRSSSFSFKGQPLDIPAIAEQLGVQYMLDGSVQKAGDSVRISVQLIHAPEDQQLWAHSWQRDLGDIFAVQQEIADSVKAAMKLKILADKRQALQKVDPEAYTLFLQARHVGQQGNVDGLLNAETMLNEALEIDPTYAPAWAYLSAVLNRQSNIGVRPSKEGHELARASANKALSIDSTNAAAWSILASISIYYDRDFQKARDFLEKARETEQNSLQILKLSSNIAFCLGNIEEAIALDQQSIDIDPVSAKSYLDLGYGYFYKGSYDEAEEMARHGLLMNPGYLGGPFLLSLILMEQGRLEEARKVAETEPYEILRTQGLALIASTQGETDSSLVYLDRIKDKYWDIAPYQIAQVYGHQNQKDSAFKWLELAYEYRDGGLVQVKADPFMKPLENDPRWEALMAKMNFP